MNPYIKEYVNTFTEEELNFILNLRKETSEKDLVIRRDSLSEKWKDIFYKIETKCLALLSDYNQQFYSLMPIDGLSLNHIGFLHDDLGSFTELHYDWELVNISDDMIIKPLIVLVYLNKPEEGGELLFPIQKYKVIPQKGKAVIFPTGFSFPHVSFPILKGEKHLMRLTYRMNNDYYKSERIEL